MTELLFLISSAKTGVVLEPLARACKRNGTSWCCFITGEGVKQLKNPELLELLPNAERAIACEHSWHEFFGSSECPAELGSQTSNSEMMTETKRVISL
jgi:hypothetical protein